MVDEMTAEQVQARTGRERDAADQAGVYRAAGPPGGHSVPSAARFEVPEGMVVQAFQFTLDLSPGEASMVRRQFGGRRYACNWAVRTMKVGIASYRATGEKSQPRR
jgi:hypothetical protein